MDAIEARIDAALRRKRRQAFIAEGLAGAGLVLIYLALMWMF
jgi:hypothetical protein